MTTETATQSQTDASTAFLRAARAGQLDKILALLNQDVDINVSNANGLNAMHLASKDGHSTVVGALLQRGAHIDAATKKGNTALHIAALAGQEAVVRLLVQSGAQVNIQSQNGFTPLYMAAQENHDGVVKFLLGNGANQSLATEDGFTPLAVAMQQGHEKVVAVLLEADTGRVRLPALHIAAKKDDCKAATLLLENDHNPDVTSKSGFTPLHIAAHYGNEAVAKLLLSKGADVNCAAKHNISPLHVAAKWGKANMVSLLTEAGAQVEAKTRDGLTPLHCAARSGHEHVVDMLLERGAPISGKSKNGLAPLHMAAQGDHSDAARILLYHRAPVDDLTVDYLTALHVAAHCGHVKVAKLLLDRNADANARALNGFTPLHIACKKNRIKVVELLLKYGASISATTESGLTPLHVAAFMGCMNIVIYLLQHEASPDVPTVRGETPLHLAARANQTDIIRILLRNGAAVDARAREQQTALHIASRLGNVDIVLLLVQHGAQLDALTADNYNALHIAAKQHNHEVAAVLLEHGAPPNAVTKKGFTPLHLAAKYGNLKVANLLLTGTGKGGAEMAEVDARGKNGVTPLHVAAQYRHHAVAMALLEKGADPKAAAKNGHTPLHIAARKNQMETAAALMERGAAVDAESRAGCTPLHLAAHQGHADMCSLLMEQGAEAGKRARSGLAALHLAAQEDHVPVAKMLVNNGAKVDVCTKGGYTPLHVASHFGQTNMVKFLLESGADVQATTCHGYSALHHAAQQGHINIVNLLLEHKADANAQTNNGQTPLDIAQRLGYVTVMDTLRGVSQPSPATQPKDDKYRPVAPETMYETFMSDSEEEGGEDTMLTDQPYRYLTVDDMKSLGDDSLPIDVTKDERAESAIGHKNLMEVSQSSAVSGPPYVVEEIATAKAVNHVYNTETLKEGYCYNVDTTQPNFLVSFLVDARGGAMRGCRGGGVRVIVPPLSAQQPTRITCRYVRAQRVSHMPPLMEGEALASRVLELGPVSAKFIGPIILEVPHYASLRGKEREIVILRSDNGTTWREHALEAADCVVQDILNDTLEIDDPPEDPGAPPNRMTRILTHDFPQYFAVISRIRQEVHAIGPEGGMVSSSVVPQVQAVFPQGALTKKIKVGLQAQTIEAELTAKLLGRGVAVSPVVTVEPRRRKFHKAITLSMPAPRPHTQGMINQYTTSAPTLRLLCSISGVFRKRSLEGGTNRAHWEDVTDSTPLTFVNDCVSFTTTVSARYWLMDCRNVSEATKMATELYREAIHVPFIARFIVYAKRSEHLQAQLRLFCVTDDREDKTLERMERFSQVAKSKDVEVHEGKPVYLEFGGNFSPVAKSGEQPRLEFRAFRENRLHMAAMVRAEHADAVARCMFMRESRRPKGEPPQPPICVLNIVLPEEVIPLELTIPAFAGKHGVDTHVEKIEAKTHAVDEVEFKWPDRLSDSRIIAMCNLLGMDWVPLAYELGVSSATVASVRERGANGAQQAALMLRIWREQSGHKAHDNCLELALCRIGREDVLLPQSTVDVERRIQRNIYQERQSSEEIIGYKSPDSDMMEKLRQEDIIMEHEDTNKAKEEETEDRDLLERLERTLVDKKMDDSVGERDEAKYSPEEKSYKEEDKDASSDREPSLSPSEESEEEEGIKKSVAERKIQITRKLSSSKVPASKQKKEIKEEIIEIKKQINPEIKKFHVQQTSLTSQESKESVGKLSKKSSSDEEEIKRPVTKPPPEPVEPPIKEKVLPKAIPRPMQKHVRNESMIRFSSGDFSDIKVTQKKPDEKVTETKVVEETTITGLSPSFKTEIKKEVTTTIDVGSKTVTITEEVLTVKERDIAEAPLKEKISSFESKMLSEKTKAETDKFESKIKLTEEALKKHTESLAPSTEYTEDFIKDQIRSQEERMSSKYENNQVDGLEKVFRDQDDPDIISDFASEMMKAEESFRASGDYTNKKYTDNYFKESHLPKTYPRAARTDSTIVQFSSEEDEYLKKSSDSETETESQIVTVKQQIGLLEEQLATEKTVGKIKLEPVILPKSKIPGETIKSPRLTISIKQELIEETTQETITKEVKVIEHDSVKTLKQTDMERLRVDSLEDSLHISSDEDAQIQPTDDESESHLKEQLSQDVEDVVQKTTPAVAESKLEQFQLSQTRSDSLGSDLSRPSMARGSPAHSATERTDSSQLLEPITDRDGSLGSRTDSKETYSRESKPTRSDSLDEASQFSDMEETQIGVAQYVAATATAVAGFAATGSPAKRTIGDTRTETFDFLRHEAMFSSSEMSPKKVVKKQVSKDEVKGISAMVAATAVAAATVGKKDEVPSDKSHESAIEKVDVKEIQKEQDTAKGIDQMVAGIATATTAAIVTAKEDDIPSKEPTASPQPPKRVIEDIKTETWRFLEEEHMFSSSELTRKTVIKKEKTPDEPVISAKARQFIETVTEDESAVPDCFFSQRIYSDSLEESEQYVTDNDSRRPSEADSIKSDKSDHLAKDKDFRMSKISSEPEEGADTSLLDDEKLDSDKEPSISDVSFNYVKKEMEKQEDKKIEEPSDVAQDSIFKRMTPKRHARNESISITKFSSLELTDSEGAKIVIVPPEIPKRATEFQMFVTEATDDYPDERGSSFEKEELSDKISSESSREIEMSDKKLSDGVSDKISSEDAATDKVSSDSGEKDGSDYRASSDTILGGDAKSPDLVIDDEEEKSARETVQAMKYGLSTLEKLESKLSEMKEASHDVTTTSIGKLDESLKGVKRSSIGSGSSVELQASSARGGKRASDAPSLTDSRDYTFEESEDSIPHGPRHDMDTKAKAILEPIYDKAMKAVRGDSLDDVEPFCMDQEVDTPRLPGIQETVQAVKVEVHETEVKKPIIVEAILKDIHTAVIKTTEPKPASVPIRQDQGKDYSVHSSPDEVEEKICTDSESELDQAKVLEIIEPTSEGEAEFAPSFDTSKLKQDSLDDADDFFPEKDMFDDLNTVQYSTTQLITGPQSSMTQHTITTTTTQKTTSELVETVKETESKIFGAMTHKVEELSQVISDLESKLIKSHDKVDALKKKVSQDKPEHEHHVSEAISDAGAVLAESVGIKFEPKDDKFEHKEVHEHHLTELMADASSTLAASIGIDFKPDEDVISRAEETIDKLHKSLDAASSVESTSQEHHVTELVTDVSSTLAKSIGVDVKKEDFTKHIEETSTMIKESTKEIEHHTSEIVTDTSTTLAASAGIDLKPEEKMDTKVPMIPAFSVESLHKQEFSVTELISDASSTLAASIGIDIKGDEEDEEVDTQGSLAESITETGAFIAASIGIHLPIEKLHKSPSKESMSRVEIKEEPKIHHEAKTTEVSDNKDEVVKANEIVDKVVRDAEEKVTEIMEIIKEQEKEVQVEKKSATETQETVKDKESVDQGEVNEHKRSHESSLDDSEDREKILSEIKNLNLSDRRCSDFLEGISQPGGSQIRIDSSHVTHELSLKFSKTPPPSPVDLVVQRERAAALAGQQAKGPDSVPEHTASSSMLSPKDARINRDFQTDGESMRTDYVAKTLSTSSSPKSPTRHHVDNIAFVNVEALTIHPEPTDIKPIAEEASDDASNVQVKLGDPEKEFKESRKNFQEETRKKFEEMKKDFEESAIAKFEQMKQEFSAKDAEKKMKDISDGDFTTVLTKKESVTHQISGKEVYSETKQILASGDDVQTKVETKREILGEEYKLKEKESTEKIGDITRSERSSLEKEQKAAAERVDSEEQKIKKSGDVTVTSTQKEFAEQGFYSGRQSKSEEKMTSIKDDIEKKTEISYSERDLSHEQWGKEYFAELEPTEELEGEYSQGKDVHMESAMKVIAKDEKISTEEILQEGKVVSSVTGYSKEESIVESKEHDDMSSDISHGDASFKSEVAGKGDSLDDKSEMSPKSRSKSFRKEEVFDVDFVKEIKVSTSQREKSFSQGGSQDTQSESDMTGESDLLAQTQQDLPDDLKLEEIIKAKPQEKISHSPVHKPEQRIQDHVWEVSVQKQESLDEVAVDLHQPQLKSIRDESQSWDMEYASHSESKSSMSGIATISSDHDVKIKLNDLSLAGSEETHDGDAKSEAFDSFKDSMLKSGESIETEYMIKSLDSQDTDTLQKSMDSVSAETMQHSEKDDFSMEADSFVADLLQKRDDHKFIKEKSLEDICSSGYDTDLSSAEFLTSKLELERADSEPTPRQQPPLSELSDLEKTIDEVKQSLEAAHGEIISEKQDKSIKYKQSPSEFEFKLISPDRPEVIHEETVPHSEAGAHIDRYDTTPMIASFIKASASSEVEEKQEVKKGYVEVGDDLSAHSKSIEISMTDKDIQISVKESDSSSKKDDTFMTSDEEKDTIQEREKQLTQHEISDISTGLESGPTSLLDTETDLISDKEESPKSSPEVKLRPIQKHVKSAHMLVTDRRSGSDLEGWSSSGESHYQSFEHTDSPHSRPLSSDVENLLTGHSTTDFQSALTTQEVSSRSQRTSKEYYSAVSTLSSRDSMRSLDSDSSSHVASIDISDASETLVPSATELKEEMMESGNFAEQFDIDPSKLKGSAIKEVDEDSDEYKTKEDLEVEQVGLAHQPVGFSDQSDEGSLDDEVQEAMVDSEVVSKMKRSHEMSFQPKELLPEKVPSDSLSESVDMDLDCGIPESDSQVFSMSKIETGPSIVRHTKQSSETKSSKSLDSTKSYEISEKTVEYHTSSVVYKTPEKKPKPVEETIIERKVTTIRTESKPQEFTITEVRDVDYDSLMKDIIPKGSSEYEEIIGLQVSKSQSATSNVSTSSSYDRRTEPYPIGSKQSSSSSLKIQDDFLSTPQTPISNPSQSSESTDNGREYVLDDMYEISEDPELFHSERAMTDSKSELSVTTEERTLYEVHKEPDSPISDEFEMVDKPNDMDDFVVIEEVAKEASEFDAEGKSVSIGKVTHVKKHDDEIEDYLTQMAKKSATDTEYSTSGSLSEEEMAQFEMEQKRLRAAEMAEIEAGKKWIQMQFEGDLAAARYDYDRGPLEDIKEEEMTDFDASRIGSLSSQKESIGSYGSMKNSYGSLSESEIAFRRRYMLRPGEQDDISVSSLQEFENLEQAMLMENYQHSSSSQDSLNGSLSRRYQLSKNGQGDDVSMSSLKEFEGLESACLEALRIEIDAKKKEAMLLSQDGRQSSAGFLDMERRSYSHGSSESSPPQKSGSPGQKSGSPSLKSGSPGQKSGSPSLKSGSPGQKFGSPSQKAQELMAIRKLIDQQLAEGGGDVKVTTNVSTDGNATVTYVTAQKKVFDNRGAFYVPDTAAPEQSEICVKKVAYECKQGDPREVCKITEQDVKDLSQLGSSFTEADANMIGVITTTKIISQRFVDGEKVSETVTVSTGKGMDIPGAVQEDQSGEYGSGSFQSLDVGSGGKSIPDYGSEFSSSITSQQSDTESLVTMMEQQFDSEHGSGPGSLETCSTLKRGTDPSKHLDLDLGLRSGETSDSGLRESSPMSNKSGSGIMSGASSKPFTDPASGSWSGLDEDMSSSGSFSRARSETPTQSRVERAREDLMLGSTDSLEQTSSNATRATYNYEVDTPMTGSLCSAGSNTMVSSLETLEPVTAYYEKADRTLQLSSEDCFTMDHSGSDHTEEQDYEVQEAVSEADKMDHPKPQARERVIRFGSDGSSDDAASGQPGPATFFIGDTPIVRGERSSETVSITEMPPIPAQRKSLTGLAKPLVDTDKSKDTEEEEDSTKK